MTIRLIRGDTLTLQTAEGRQEKMIEERRRSHRRSITNRIQISHPFFGTAIATIGNVSDSGMFLVISDIELPPVDTVIELQALDLAENPPLLKAKIVREESGGVGLMFCE